MFLRHRPKSSSIFLPFPCPASCLLWLQWLCFSQSPLGFHLICFLTALCISVGQDPPVVAVPFVPATVAPRLSYITTASQPASVTNTTTAHTASRSTRRPIVVPPSKNITTKKPPRLSVIEAKSPVSFPRLTTLSTQTTSPPQPGSIVMQYLLLYYTQ